MLIERICADYDRTPAPFRKAVNYQTGLGKHQLTGAYLHFVSELRKIQPSSQFKDAEVALKEQFLSGYLDCDLQHALDTTAPPSDLKTISAMRRMWRHEAINFVDSRYLNIDSHNKIVRKFRDKFFAKALRRTD